VPHSPSNELIVSTVRLGDKKYIEREPAHTEMAFEPIYNIFPPTVNSLRAEH
jgi:hypothetical protein